MKSHLLLSLLLLSGCAEKAAKAASTNCPQPTGLFRIYAVEHGGNCGPLERNIAFDVAGAVADPSGNCTGSIARAGTCTFDFRESCALYSLGRGSGEYYGSEHSDSWLRVTGVNYLRGEMRRSGRTHDSKSRCFSTYDINMWKID